jgi:hypothetical protein
MELSSIAISAGISASLGADLPTCCARLTELVRALKPKGIDCGRYNWARPDGQELAHLDLFVGDGRLGV